MKTRNSRGVRIVGWSMHLGGLTVTGLLIMLFYLGYHRPARKGLENDSKELQRLQQVLASSRKIRREHADLQATTRQLQQRSDAMRKRIPDRSGEADFLDDVSRIASQIGMNVLDYRRGNVINTTSHSQLELSMKCEGEFATICRFVDELHRLPRISSVRKVVVDSNDESDSPYLVELTIVLYFGIKSQRPAPTE